MDVSTRHDDGSTFINSGSNNVQVDRQDLGLSVPSMSGTCASLSARTGCRLLNCCTQRPVRSSNHSGDGSRRSAEGMLVKSQDFLCTHQTVGAGYKRQASSFMFAAGTNIGPAIVVG